MDCQPISLPIFLSLLFSLSGVFPLSVPTRTSVVLSRNTFCWAKRAIKPVQGYTGLIAAPKTAQFYNRPRMEIFKNVLPCTFLNYEFFSGKTRPCSTPPDILSVHKFDISPNLCSSVVLRTYNAWKWISASIAVRDTTFPISVYSSHTAVTRSMRKRVFFRHFIVCFSVPNSFQNLSNTVLQYPFLYLFKSF